MAEIVRTYRLYGRGQDMEVVAGCKQPGKPKTTYSVTHNNHSELDVTEVKAMLDLVFCNCLRITRKSYIPSGAS